MRGAFFAGLAVAMAFAVPARELTFVSYNIRHGEGTDHQLRLDRTAQVIAELQADFVGLQEVDRGVGRTLAVDQVSELARDTGLKGTFARAVDLGGGEYGVATLTADEPLSVMTVPLPGEEKRVLLVTESEDCFFATAHFCYVSEEVRLESIAIISNVVAKLDKPVVFTGDFNATTNSVELQALERFMTVVSDVSVGSFHGFPGWRTWKRPYVIDFIAVDRAHAHAVEVLESKVVVNRVASDHSPVMVRLSLDDRREPSQTSAGMKP